MLMAPPPVRRCGDFELGFELLAMLDLAPLCGTRSDLLGTRPLSGKQSRAMVFQQTTCGLVAWRLQVTQRCLLPSSRRVPHARKECRDSLPKRFLRDSILGKVRFADGSTT